MSSPKGHSFLSHSPVEPHKLWRRRLLWLSGLGFVVLVIALTEDLLSPGELVERLEQADLRWILLVIALQFLTYFAEGENWRVVLRARDHRVSAWQMWKLALAKLFIDQAIPSAGLSGTAVIGVGLHKRGIPQGVVMAAIVVDIASYYFSYFICLVMALVIVSVYGQGTPILLVLVVLVTFVGSLIVGAVFSIAGRGHSRLSSRLQRIPLLRDGVAYLESADRQLATSPKLLAQATLCQMATVFLDVLSIGVLLRAFHVSALLPLVFASFLVSSLLRTISVIPAGLGPFEAASVTTLQMAKVPLDAALAATLAFRVMSFWLPLIPGLALARVMTRRPRGGEEPRRS